MIKKYTREVKADAEFTNLSESKVRCLESVKKREDIVVFQGQGRSGGGARNQCEEEGTEIRPI